MKRKYHLIHDYFYREDTVDTKIVLEENLVDLFTKIMFERVKKHVDYVVLKKIPYLL